MSFYLVSAIIVALALFPVLRWLARVYLRFRGERVVICPETQQPAGVEVDAKHAVMATAVGAPSLRLKDCSRWPERRNCGQECLRQIEAAPEDCLVRNILTRWYERKSCVYCGKPVGEIHWLEHKPALMSPERQTVEWREVRPESLPSVLATHQPVCWNCHIAETFRREFPDLVVDRPATIRPHACAGTGTHRHPD